MFLSPLFQKTSLAIRIVGAIHAGSGDAALQINIVGEIEHGQQNGFIDLLASVGHMRWLHPGNESLRRDRIQRLGSMDYFAARLPWLGAGDLCDSDKGTSGPTPWSTCGQGRRKEKGPIAPPTFTKIRN